VAVRGAAAAGLTVEIRNPWPMGVAPTTPIPGAGMGIIGLSERAALTGGQFRIPWVSFSRPRCGSQGLCRNRWSSVWQLDWLAFRGASYDV
jgi:hypothetical protein